MSKPRPTTTGTTTNSRKHRSDLVPTSPRRVGRTCRCVPHQIGPHTLSDLAVRGVAAALCSSTDAVRVLVWSGCLGACSLSGDGGPWRIQPASINVDRAAQRARDPRRRTRPRSSRCHHIPVQVLQQPQVGVLEPSEQRKVDRPQGGRVVAGVDHDRFGLATCASGASPPTPVPATTSAR